MLGLAPARMAGAGMSLIDGGSFAGHDLATGLDWPIEAVLADFDRRGVTAGLVASWRCLYQDLEAGNREAAEWGRAHPGRVIPLAIVHPAWYGTSPAELMRHLKGELGFRAVAVSGTPSYYPVDWGAPAVRAIGESAAEQGMVLQALIANDGDLGGVVRAWGSLDTPVMIRWMAGHRYKYIASEFAAAAATANLFFDVSNLCSTGALELFARRLGGQRLFLAGNAPYAVAECGQAMLECSALDSTARAAIESGTLEEILAWEEPRSAKVPDAPAMAAITAIVRRPKVDIHWHPDHWNLGEPALDFDSQLATLDRFNIERVIMFSIRALNDSLAEGNRFTAGCIDRDSRIYGMLVLDPLRPRESQHEIERWARHPRFVGIKTIQDVAGLRLDSPEYQPYLEQAERLSLPVLAHLPGMAEAARRHPTIQFIAAHGNWGRARHLAELPNINFDFSTGHANRQETQLARFVEAVSPDRVLFGSDAQLVSPAWSLAKLATAGLEDRVLDRILRRNAYRLFPKLAD